ncbi:UDP-glucose 4-epimerase [Chitinophaga sp. YR627]|uniref:polysaccharide biosynthesis protein n=1 Tax=Chitinophaga sp. YR627 TaxID=1881041 RepID=UPI0008EEFDAC|nr:polysaccharide biosynthesis protein [Chitinophaga sp. YR627]SFM75739.1 UDP-glucose 4-epimerase [Chitinophaga sp. YR627]
MFKDKCLLITGGTGSFGNAVLKRFLPTDIREIRIFSRDEKKQDDMRNLLRSDKVKFFMGDVRDYRSIDNAMDGVDYVFHAAALKQVPSCEFYPMEAVRTNVLGTENVVEAAIKHKIEKLICLGTDKAVYPINAMGISKAMMEKVAISKARLHNQPLITCTRYGNVMASRGSVIPLFISQIRAGLPLTITDPKMTRFMMSLDNAVELVLFAYKNANPGDIFVQKAPAATIGQLASVLIDMFESRSEINIIGTRHGEKLYETLLTREEFGKAEDMGEFYRIAADDRDLNYAKYFSEGNERIAEAQDYHSHNTYRLSDDELRNMLLKLDYVQEQLSNSHVGEGELYKG